MPEQSTTPTIITVAVYREEGAGHEHIGFADFNLQPEYNYPLWREGFLAYAENVNLGDGTYYCIPLPTEDEWTDSWDGVNIHGKAYRLTRETVYRIQNPE